MAQHEVSIAINRIREVATQIGLDQLLESPQSCPEPDLDGGRTICGLSAAATLATIDRERLGAIRRSGAEAITARGRTIAGREKFTAFLFRQPDAHYVTLVCRHPPRRKPYAVALESADRFTRLQAIRHAERELHSMLSVAKQRYA